MEDGQWTVKGKVALVTGATGGLGYVAAQRLAASGARLYWVGRDGVRTRQPATAERTTDGGRL